MLTFDQFRMLREGDYFYDCNNKNISKLYAKKYNLENTMLCLMDNTYCFYRRGFFLDHQEAVNFLIEELHKAKQKAELQVLTIENELENIKHVTIEPSNKLTPVILEDRHKKQFFNVGNLKYLVDLVADRGYNYLPIKYNGKNVKLSLKAKGSGVLSSAEQIELTIEEEIKG